MTRGDVQVPDCRQINFNGCMGQFKQVIKTAEFTLRLLVIVCVHKMIDTVDCQLCVQVL